MKIEINNIELKNVLNNEIKLFGFEKFNIYIQAFDFFKKIYNVLNNFPKSEQNILVAQLKCSALSIVLNIAEGSGKYYSKEKIRHLRIARGSIFECVPALRFSLEQNYLGFNKFNELYNDCYELSKQTSGLIKYLNKN